MPEPSLGQVRVRVRASALNRADLLQREGNYPVPSGYAADIAGIEYAGEVDELGTGASLWKKGDRVMGVIGGAGHAERGGGSFDDLHRHLHSAGRHDFADRRELRRAARRRDVYSGPGADNPGNDRAQLGGHSADDVCLNACREFDRRDLGNECRTRHHSF